MRTTSKTVLMAGAIAAFVAVGPVGKEAEAEPVVSSWYGSELEGAPTASGEPYRPDEYTAAHPSLPFGTELLVTYGEQETVVRVTDRGPHVEGRGIDLSRAAAQDIGLTTAGADAVDVRVFDSRGVRDEYDPLEEYVPPRGHAPTKEHASQQEYSPRNENAPGKKHDPRGEYAPRKDRDGIAAYLRERPYLKILGAATAHSRPSNRACRDALMTAPTPTAGRTRLPSVESTRARIVAAVVPCSPGTRSLWHSPVRPRSQI